jgi:protein-tyrosine phosphatase
LTAVADEERLRILVVCTANQCRSPLAAGALSRRAAAERLPVEVSSAGVAVMPGVSATAPTVAAARALGFDVTNHVATALEYDLVRGADLVIGLERRHVQEIVVHDPEAFAKTFTLKELVRRGTDVGPRASEQPLREWLSEVHRGRRAQDLLGMSTADDVTDPTGSATVDHDTVADEIDDLARQVLDLLFDPRGVSRGATPRHRNRNRQ